MKKVVAAIFASLALAAFGLSAYLRPEPIRVLEFNEMTPTREPDIPFTEVTVKEEALTRAFYYQRLENEEEQQSYKEIYSGISAQAERITCHEADGDRVFKLFEYVLQDHPEIFWCDGEVKISIHSGLDPYTELQISYNYTKEQRAEKQAVIDRAVTEILAGIDAKAGDYEKILYVYDYIVKNVGYDEKAPDNQNIYSVFGNRASVCAGYSKALQYLLARLDVFATYVTGTSMGGPHAWNLVRCNDYYYYVDVTWGDPVFQSEGHTVPGAETYVSYDYLLTNQTELEKTHTFDELALMPECNRLDENYYVKNGMYLQTYDPAKARAQMNADIDKKKALTVFKFNSAELYQRAYREIIDDLLPQAARRLGELYRSGNVRYYYMDDADLNKVTIFWQY